MFVFVKRHAFKNRHHKMMVMTDDITHEDKVKCEQPLVEFTDRNSTFMATMGSTDAAKLDILLEHTLLFQRVPTNDRGWVEFNNGAN
jgi:hypothetical protein